MSLVDKYKIIAIGPLGTAGQAIAQPIMSALDNDATVWKLLQPFTMAYSEVDGSPRQLKPKETITLGTLSLKAHVDLVRAGTRGTDVVAGERYRAPMFGLLAFLPTNAKTDELDQALARGYVMWAYMLSLHLEDGHKVFWRKEPSFVTAPTNRGDDCRFLKWQLAMKMSDQDLVKAMSGS